MPNIIKLTPSLCGCSPIQIGYRVENDARAIEFDFTEWSDEYGSGAVELLVKRKGDQAAYPVALEINGTVATWVISDTDTSVPGYGKAEYTYTVGTTLAKTAVFTFFVAEDLGGTTQDPPDPYQTWVDTLTSLGAETLGNAIRAEDAADRAEDAQSAAEQSAEEAATSATNAAQSAGAARFAAESALASSDSASASATAASGHATAAEAAKDLAISAAEDAQHSETQAELSASAAAESAESASGSATSASESASVAVQAVTTAASSASVATQAAQNASASATTASNAATSATQSASNAAQSASAASGSASAAATSAESAASSATSAAASATEAATEAAKLNNYLPVDSASGSIASFPDGADDVPVEALTVSLEPVQDLHGYDNPWPGGGGKNLADTRNLDVTMAGIRCVSDSNGVISLSGTRDSSTGWKAFVSFTNFAPGNYVFSTNNTHLTCLLNFTQKSGEFTVAEGDVVRIALANVTAGDVINETGIKVQIESGSTATAWSPYENTCPIIGFEQIAVTRTGKNIFDESVFAEIGAVLQEDGTYYFQTASAFLNKVIWTNDSGYTGALNLAIKYRYSSDSSSGIRPIVHYTDGTSTQLYMRATATEATCTYTTNSAKTVSKITLTYGSGSVGTWWNFAMSPQSLTEYEPYSGQTVEVTFPAMGANQWDEEWEIGGYANANGQPWNTTDRIRSKTTNYISVAPNTRYYFATPQVANIYFYDADKNYITNDSVKNFAFTTPSNARYMRFSIQPAYGTTYNNDISINYPATVTTYEPYRNTVYGGTLDVLNGVLTVDRAMVDLGSLYWRRNGTNTYYYSDSLSSVAVKPTADGVLANIIFEKYASLPSAAGGIYPNRPDAISYNKNGNLYTVASEEPSGQCVYELATPITIDLTDIPTISTLLGQNNVWSDSGDVDVTYRADIQKYIAKVIAEAIS